MLVEMYEGVDLLGAQDRVRRVEVELESGQRFGIIECGGYLSISADSRLAVLPCASNVVVIKAVD